jgi:hypothetical protein
MRQAVPSALKDLDLSELDTVVDAVDTLLERFAKYMDDPKLTEELGGFRASLRVERTRREKLRGGATANAKAS